MLNFRIDRHFLFLKNDNLATFAERILRNTTRNPYYKKENDISEAVETGVKKLRIAMTDPFLKRKDRIPLIKVQEATLLKSLEKLAEHIETTLDCKADILSTGFHLHTDSKENTRRQQRMGLKIEKIGISAN